MIVESDGASDSALQFSAAEIAEFFHPRGIVIVGSVDRSAFTKTRNERFGCPVCYVNPRGGGGGGGGGGDGVDVYTSLDLVPDPVDLAIVKVRPELAIPMIDACALRGIQNVLVISNGFGEIGAEGVDFERRLVEAIRRTGLRVIGPNTNENAFEAFPLPPGHRGGRIGLITQSGFQGRAVVEGTAIGAGFSRWVPTGNEAGLESADMLSYFAEDAATTAIAAYIEGFKSGDKLRAGLWAANQRKKPVVMLKMGATQQGAKMATSHTGHLTGADAVVDGLFAQYGVTRVRDLDELLETANLFAKFPSPDAVGPRCALYSVSGGSATLMAECAEMFGVPAPALTAQTQEALKALFPPYLEVSNPIDNGGTFLVHSPVDKRIAALDLIAADPNVDIVVIGVSGAYAGLSDPFSADLLAWAPTAKKPVVATWNSPRMNTPAFENVLLSGVPMFRSFRGCFQALRAYADYGRRMGSFRLRDRGAPALSIAQQAALATAGVAGAAASAALLQGAGIPLVRERVARSAQEAREAAADIGANIGGRLVMKILSPAFPHKSDVGLVRLGVVGAEAAATVYDELVERARLLDRDALIEGVSVQEQIGGGVEMIVGLSQDPQFGPVLTVGAGGIHAEILRDVAVRPLPVDRRDVEEMIASLKLGCLLDGVRGAPPSDKSALIDLVLRVAGLGLAAGDRLAELDLNPVIVLPDRAVAVDALVVVAEPAQQEV